MTDILLIESPESMIEGTKMTYSVTFQGAGSVSSVTGVAYKDGTDISSTVFPSGSTSASGNVATLKELVAGDNDGGKIYVVIIGAVVDSNTEKRKLIVNIVKASAEV